MLFSILVVYLATMLGFVIRAKYLSTIVKTASETAAEQLREANKALQDLAAAGVWRTIGTIVHLTVAWRVAYASLSCSAYTMCSSVCHCVADHVTVSQAIRRQ